MSKIPRIHQLGSTMGFGDAITNHIFEIDRILKQWGHESHIFANKTDEVYAGKAQPDTEYAAYLDNEEDLLIFHYSVFCENIQLYQRSKNRKILVYHNITPPEFFIGYNPYIESLCRMGREALSMLTSCDLAIGDSEHNRQELVEAGFEEQKTDVLPIFLHCESYDAVKTNQRIQKKYADTTNLITVGRVAPNKKIEDVVKAFYCYHEFVNKESRLFIIGAMFAGYILEIGALVTSLGLDHCVVITGQVPLEGLKTYYELADAYICMSEHEGYCVPLVESMYFNVPIIAYDSTAIPWTLGDAGVIVKNKDYVEIAEIIDLVITDDELRERILERQRQRFQALSPAKVEQKLRSILNGLGFENA